MTDCLTAEGPTLGVLGPSRIIVTERAPHQGARRWHYVAGTIEKVNPVDA